MGRSLQSTTPPVELLIQFSLTGEREILELLHLEQILVLSSDLKTSPI